MQRLPRPDHGVASRAQLFDAGDKREHDTQRPVRRGAQQGAQLRLKDFVDGEAQADAAHAERRARALDGRMLDAQLRLADIERADRHSPRRRTLHELTIGAVLRLFGQGRLATAREQELGAKQTNARRSALRCARRIVRGLDVRLESNLDAVFCDSRQIAILVERLFERLTTPLSCVYQSPALRDQDR